ncbi:MAG: hypothetical protein OXI18_10205 [bacterium]|nr:hypothetical protein [bacterium]
MPKRTASAGERIVMAWFGPLSPNLSRSQNPSRNQNLSSLSRNPSRNQNLSSLSRNPSRNQNLSSLSRLRPK